MILSNTRLACVDDTKLHLLLALRGKVGGGKNSFQLGGVRGRVVRVLGVAKFSRVLAVRWRMSLFQRVAGALRVGGRLGRLAHLCTFLSRRTNACRLKRLRSVRVGLTLRRTIAGIVRCTCPSGGSRSVHVSVDCRGGQLAVIVASANVDFGPLRERRPSLALSLRRHPANNLKVCLIGRLVARIDCDHSTKGGVLAVTGSVY